MHKITTKIGILYEAIEKLEKKSIVHDMLYKQQTRVMITGVSKNQIVDVVGIIKKNTQGLEISCEKEVIKCAKKHILIKNLSPYEEIFASDLRIGDMILKNDNTKTKVTDIKNINATTFYDLSVKHIKHINTNGVLSKNVLCVYDTEITIRINDERFATFVDLPINTFKNIKIGDLCNSLIIFDNKNFENNIHYDTWVDIDVLCSNTLEYTKLQYFSKKQQMVYKILFDNNTSIVCSFEHTFFTDLFDTVSIKNLKIGDKIKSPNGKNIVKNITTENTIDVFSMATSDVALNNTSHVYSTSNNILHHNTAMCASLCDIYGSSGYRILIIVPSSDLVDQTHKTLKMFGLNAGIYSGDLKQNGGFDHIVATWQALQYNPFMVSATSLPDSNGNRTSFDGFITDEVQGMKSEVLSTLSSDYGKHLPFRFGITGTLPKPADEEMSILSSLGDILFRITTKWLIDNGYLADLEIEMIVTQEGKKESFPDYASEKSWVSKNNDRLSLIAHDIINHTKVYGNTFVLVDSIEQGKILESLIPDSVFMWGDTKKGIRQSKYADFDTMNGLTVIANMPIASTGISIDRIFCLCLIDSGKSFVRTIQSIGRGLRLAHDKKIVFIKDYSSSLKYGSKHRKERLKWYDEQEYDKITTRKLK